jgi:hypothetical protein
LLPSVQLLIENRPAVRPKKLGPNRQAARYRGAAALLSISNDVIE